jgi:hypothetical protein
MILSFSLLSHKRRRNPIAEPHKHNKVIRFAPHINPAKRKKPANPGFEQQFRMNGTETMGR